MSKDGLSGKDSEHVAAVVNGDEPEVRIYGPVQMNGLRPLKRVIPFNNYGQARLYAQEYDEQRK